MTEQELARTFWPGSRKELFIESVVLQMRSNLQHVKVGLMMPLSDGKLVGMPSWVGEGFDHIGKQDTLESSIKYTLELKEMSLYIHSTEDTPKASQTVFNVFLTAFSLRRDEQDENNDEVSDVNLHFVSYIPFTAEFWAWIGRHYRKTIFVRFETTQAELPSGQEKPSTTDTQMKLGEDGYEAARREATSKDHDAEFARA
jgi:hypothetical protein